jgi:hypothetical protein
MKKAFLGFICLLALPALLRAQAPISNLYLFDLKKANDSIFQFSAPRFLTASNINGYNNHPYFFSNEELYLSVQQPNMRVPDFFALNLRTNTRTRVTDTPEGEYSPRPLGDEVHFTAVRMEFVGRDTLQRLWQFPLNRSNKGQVLLPDVVKVGYYAWLNTHEVMMYLVGKPSQLVKTDVFSPRKDVIALNIGRCIKHLSNGMVYYVQKSISSPWQIMRYDPRNSSIRVQATVVTNTLPDAEDFTVMNDGVILMASGSTLYKFKPGSTDRKWKKIGDFQTFGIRRITRIELSPDNSKIVLVSNE